MTQEDRLAQEASLNRILLKLDLIGVAVQGVDPELVHEMCGPIYRRDYAIASREIASLKQWLLQQLAELRGRPLD